MEIGSTEWKRLIVDGAKKFDIHIDRQAADQFAAHGAELLKWNRKTNLTAISDPREVAVKHFLDSIVPAEIVPPGASMLDIGSGAGFPGIPLKIIIPSLCVTLIDASRKKVSFLKYVIRMLKLKNIQARQVRAEALAGHSGESDGFDVVISRALTSAEDFISMAAPLMAKNGMLIVMKGSGLRQELDSVGARVRGKAGLLEIGDAEYILTWKNYTLQDLELRRSILIIRNADI